MEPRIRNMLTTLLIAVAVAMWLLSSWIIYSLCSDMETLKSQTQLLTEEVYHYRKALVESNDHVKSLEDELRSFRALLEDDGK